MKSKNVLDALLFGGFTICIVCVLVACSGKTQEKAESQISEDIQEQDDYFNSYKLTVDSFSISKRQTNVDDKNDFVWCTVTASNKNFSYSAQYKLTYVLYNDGWLLEEYNQESSSVTPISPPTQTQDEAMALVLADWDEGGRDNVSERHIAAKSSLQKLSELSYAYYFRIAWKNSLGLNGIPVDYAVFYQFDLVSGWSSEVSGGVNIRWG